MNASKASDDFPVSIVTVTEAGQRHSLEATARLLDLHPDMLRHYCRIGLLGDALAQADRDPEFDDNLIYELRRIEHYRRYHGIDRRALPLICALWRDVERLHAEVRILRGR